MKELKFTRVYGMEENGKRCVVGYKCSNERFEIIKCGECYDVYEDGMFECIFYRLKDAKREIATRIKWLADEEIEQVNETTKQAEETKGTKHYKEYKKEFIGDSEGATLRLNGLGIDGELKAEDLCFGIDSAYSAYIVDDDCAIPEHYKLRHSFTKYVTIFGDSGYINFKGDNINIYTCGDCGCIIQILSNKRRNIKNGRVKPASIPEFIKKFK